MASSSFTERRALGKLGGGCGGVVGGDDSCEGDGQW